MSITDSDNESERFESEFPSEDVMPRDTKFHEIIEDNKWLRGVIKKAASEMSTKNRDFKDFYAKMKISAQNLYRTLSATKVKVNEQEREITLLRSERLKLQMETTIHGTAAIAINDADLNNGEIGDRFQHEYKETLEAFERQLKESELEKIQLKEGYDKKTLEFRGLWENRERECHAILQRNQQQWQNLLHQTQVKHEENLREQLSKSERTETELKAQVTTMINEHRSDKIQLGKVEAQVELHKKRVQDMDAINFQVRKDIEKCKHHQKNLEDELVRTKEELETATTQLNEKKKSLDELFEVYDKARDELQRVTETAPIRSQSEANSQQQLDKVYAQYLCAEESLKKKKDEINVLSKKNEVIERESMTQINLYKQQADIFKKDFEIEREARQKQHMEYESMKTMVAQYQIEMQRMKQDVMRSQALNLQRPYAP